MTVSSLISRNDYTGTGTTGPFPYYFRIFAATDLVLTVRDTATGLDTILEYPRDYAVTNVGGRSGGMVRLTDALAVTETLAIRRKVPVLQPADIRNQGVFSPESIEDALDRQTMVAQEHGDQLGRALKLADAYDPAAYDMTLPAPAPGKAVVWNIDGSGFDNANLSDAQLSAWSASQNQRLDTFVAGTHFTAGTSMTLALTDPPGDIANVHLVRRTSGVVYPILTDECSVDPDGLITFVNPIPAGTTRIEARYFQTYQVNTALARNVRLTLGDGRTVQTVEAHLDNNKVFSVRDYGAKGDGIVDDYAAFAAAITAARAAKGSVFVPRTAANLYRVSQTLALGTAALAYVPLVGDASIPAIQFTGASGFVVSVSGNDIPTAVNAGLLRNVELRNTLATLADGGIQLYYVGLLRCENVRITANGIGIDCNEAISCSFDNVFVAPSVGTGLWGKRGFARNFVWNGGRIYGYQYGVDVNGDSHAFRGLNMEFCECLIRTTAANVAQWDQCHFESSALLLTNAVTVPRVALGGAPWVDNGSNGVGISGGMVFRNCLIALQGETQTNLVVLKNSASFVYELTFDNCYLAHGNLRICGSFTPGNATNIPAGSMVRILGFLATQVTLNQAVDVFSQTIKQNLTDTYFSGLTATNLAVANALQADQNATANETRLLLWDVTAGALRRVTRGALDSGGAGFRVLRIPN